MLRTLTITGALVAGLFCFGPASAQKIDANGRCHASNGQFAKAEVCGGVSLAKGSRAAPSVMAAASPAAAAVGKATRCRDANGKFMSCGAAMAATAAAKPASATAGKAVRCKDAKGKFAKCDAPGAHPA